MWKHPNEWAAVRRRYKADKARGHAAFLQRHGLRRIHCEVKQPPRAWACGLWLGAQGWHRTRYGAAMSWARAYP